MLAEESTDLLRFIKFIPYVVLALFPTKDKKLPMTTIENDRVA
jgi:hypothetical protein